MIGHSEIQIEHVIAQKNIVFSNSMVKALNNVVKHQFLYPHNIESSNQLLHILEESVVIYNSIRPQMSLGENTPQKTFNGLSVDFYRYSQNSMSIKPIEDSKTRKMFVVSVYKSKLDFNIKKNTLNQILLFASFSYF